MGIEVLSNREGLSNRIDHERVHPSVQIRVTKVCRILGAQATKRHRVPWSCWKTSATRYFYPGSDAHRRALGSLCLSWFGAGSATGQIGLGEHSVNPRLRQRPNCHFGA